MRIGLRLLYNSDWMGGINYVLNIARLLRSLDDAVRPEIVFLTSTPQAEIIASEHSELADEINNFTEVHALNLDFVYPATQLTEAPFGAPWGGWIPDWQCQHNPEMFDEKEKSRRFMHYRELAKGPTACLFSSQQAIEDTRKLFPNYDSSKWHVFNFPAVFDENIWSVNEKKAAEIRSRLNIPEQYLIVCNQFWKHKNHLLIAEALQQLPETDIHVVMTGALVDDRWPKYAEKMKALFKQPEIANRITITGRISREEQLSLLAGATGYIQPSFFEGWSTFVEEARALGLPGLLSDIPVHKEQSPPCSVYFDPNSSLDLAEKLNSFLEGIPQRPTPVQARKNQENYINKCAAQFLKIAKLASKNYQQSKHGTFAILERRIPELYENIDKDERYTRADFDAWLAGIRMLLREHPEDLARLAGKLCQPENSFAELAPNLVVIGTLAKCSPEIQQRFLDFRPENDAQAQIIENVQKAVKAPNTRVQLVFERTLFRLQDLVRRKLSIK